jgi:hypothetical protein
VTNRGVRELVNDVAHALDEIDAPPPVDAAERETRSVIAVRDL